MAKWIYDGDCYITSCCNMAFDVDKFIHKGSFMYLPCKCPNCNSNLELPKEMNSVNKGTFVINPYVKPYFDGKPNPYYKTMYLRKSDQWAECMAYTGEIIKFPYKEVIQWETAGSANYYTLLKREFGITNGLWSGIGLKC